MGYPFVLVLLLSYVTQEVDRDSLASWLEYLSSEARAAQLLNKNSHVIKTLNDTLSRYVTNVTWHSVTADKR